jgi:adenylylsulfate kinase
VRDGLRGCVDAEHSAGLARPIVVIVERLVARCAVGRCAVGRYERLGQDLQYLISAGPSRNLRDMSDRIDRGFCLWFTGLSGAGKSTIAELVVAELRDRGHRVELLDGDEVREHISAGLTFSKEDRDINIKRIGFVASLLARNGVVAVTAAISPYRAIRDEVRGWIDDFVEVYVATSLEDCEARDVKGLYAKARAGDIPQFTGLSDPYEPPLDPEVRVETTGRAPEESAKEVLAWLERAGLSPVRP